MNITIRRYKAKATTAALIGGILLVMLLVWAGMPWIGAIVDVLFIYVLIAVIIDNDRNNYFRREDTMQLYNSIEELRAEINKLKEQQTK